MHLAEQGSKDIQSLEVFSFLQLDISFGGTEWMGTSWMQDRDDRDWDLCLMLLGAKVSEIGILILAHCLVMPIVLI
jgi:hypothetical protein